jgi:hypothetical protein
MLSKDLSSQSADSGGTVVGELGFSHGSSKHSALGSSEILPLRYRELIKRAPNVTTKRAATATIVDFAFADSRPIGSDSMALTKVLQLTKVE